MRNMRSGWYAGANLRLMVDSFPRRIKATVRDSNGDLIPGARVAWMVNGEDAGSGEKLDGSSTLEVTDHAAVVSVKAAYAGDERGPVTLAADQQEYEFMFDVEINPRWRRFLMKHFPALVGVTFILLTITLAFVFRCPTALQIRVILGTFAIGAGGFGGEIAGFLRTTLTLGQRLRISAGGAMAVFVLLFFFVPAGAPDLAACPP